MRIRDKNLLPQFKASADNNCDDRARRLPAIDLRDVIYDICTTDLTLRSSDEHDDDDDDDGGNDDDDPEDRCAARPLLTTHCIRTLSLLILRCSFFFFSSFKVIPSNLHHVRR